MRFLMLVKSNKEIETGVLPDKELFVAMERYNNELEKAGVLISLDGLHPSSKGARVSFSNGKTVVTDGPFQNPEELVAGFWVIKTTSKEEAVQWAQKIPFKDGLVEIRQIQEMSDFPEEIQQTINSKQGL
jgi:hypothetical protein